MNTDRRTLLAGLAGLAGLAVLPLLLAGAQADTGARLTLGIMPFNSALALIKTHQPLRQFLEAQLGTPIDVYTAPDYTRFVRESLAGRYDLLITGPHFAVMSVEKGYVPLVRYRATLQPIFVIRPGSGIEAARDLRGRVVALSSLFSVSSIGGMKWLADKDMQAGRDYRIREYPTHGAAIAAVAVGEADAALTTYTPLQQIPADVRNKVVELPSEIRMPHLMTLAHRRLGDPRIAAIRKALWNFAESPEGQRFFQDTGYQGYEPVSHADLEALTPYVAIVRQQMRLETR